MIQSIKNFINLIISFFKRRWTLARQFDYGRALKTLMAALADLAEALPGILAWSIEVTSLVAAGLCIWQASRLGYELELWSAAAMIAMAGMLVGLCLLTDYYTDPNRTKQGGGG